MRQIRRAFQQTVAAPELAAKTEQAAFFHRAIREIHAKIVERAAVEIHAHAMRHGADLADVFSRAREEGEKNRQRAVELTAPEILAHLFGLEKRVVEHRIERGFEVMQCGAELHPR